MSSTAPTSAPRVLVYSPIDLPALAWLQPDDVVAGPRLSAAPPPGWQGHRILTPGEQLGARALRGLLPEGWSPDLVIVLTAAPATDYLRNVAAFAVPVWVVPVGQDFFGSGREAFGNYLRAESFAGLLETRFRVEAPRDGLVAADHTRWVPNFWASHVAPATAGGIVALGAVPETDAQRRWLDQQIFFAGLTRRTVTTLQELAVAPETTVLLSSAQGEMPPALNMLAGQGRRVVIWGLDGGAGHQTLPDAVTRDWQVARTGDELVQALTAAAAPAPARDPQGEALRAALVRELLAETGEPITVQSVAPTSATRQLAFLRRLQAVSSALQIMAPPDADTPIARWAARAPRVALCPYATLADEQRPLAAVSAPRRQMPTVQEVLLADGREPDADAIARILGAFAGSYVLLGAEEIAPAWSETLARAGFTALKGEAGVYGCAEPLRAVRAAAAVGQTTGARRRLLAFFAETAAVASALEAAELARELGDHDLCQQFLLRAVSFHRESPLVHPLLATHLLAHGDQVGACIVVAEARRLTNEPDARLQALAAQLEASGVDRSEPLTAYRRARGEELPRTDKPQRYLLLLPAFPPQVDHQEGFGFWELASQLRRAGHEVIVLSADIPGLSVMPDETRDWFEAFVLRDLQLADSHEQAVEANLQRLREILENLPVDRCLAAGLHFLGGGLRDLLLEFQVPTLEWLDSTSATCDLTAVATQPGYRQVVTRSAHATRGNRHDELSTVPLPFAPRDAYQFVFPDFGALRMVCPTALHRESLVSRLLETCSVLASRGVPFTLDLLDAGGDPTLVTEMKAYVNKQPMARCIRWADPDAPLDLEAIRRRANVWIDVAPGAGATEGAWQARLAGLLVLTPHAPEMPGPERYAGIDVSSSHRLADALCAFWRHPAAARAEAVRGQTAALSRLPTAVTAQVEELFAAMPARAETASTPETPVTVPVIAPAPVEA